MNSKLTVIGNATCTHSSYNRWNSRGLAHIQNNQGGNILIDIYNAEMHISCSNEIFATSYIKEHYNKENAIKNKNNPSYWNLFYYKG